MRLDNFVDAMLVNMSDHVAQICLGIESIESETKNEPKRIDSHGPVRVAITVRSNDQLSDPVQS